MAGLRLLFPIMDSHHLPLGANRAEVKGVESLARSPFAARATTKSASRNSNHGIGYDVVVGRRCALAASSALAVSSKTRAKA